MPKGQTLHERVEGAVEKGWEWFGERAETWTVWVFNKRAKNKFLRPRRGFPALFRFRLKPGARCSPTNSSPCKRVSSTL